MSNNVPRKLMLILVISLAALSATTWGTLAAFLPVNGNSAIVYNDPADTSEAIYIPLVGNNFTSVSLEVTTVADAVNGDTANPQALLASPGPDGISLREALLAVNNGQESSFTITFSPTLAGATIQLTDQLLITQDHVTITGLTDNAGKPAISIKISIWPRGGFKVVGSYITIRRLRFSEMSGTGGWAGVFIEPDSGGTVAHVLIENNLFEGSGTDSSAGISFRNNDGVWPTTIKDVTISGNTFSHFRCDCDGIHLGARGSNSLRENITIRNNTFLDSNFPIELEASGANNRIQHVQITQNYFANNFIAIAMGSMGDADQNYTGNVVSDTLIYDNVFEGNEAGMSIYSGSYQGTGGNLIQNTQVISNLLSSNYQGIYIGGGNNGAHSSVVSDTLIARNIFVNSTVGGIGISAGGQPSSDGNAVYFTQIINNLFTGNQDHAIGISGGWDSATDNHVVGVTIFNNTFTNNGTDFFDPSISVSIGDPGNTISGVEIVNSIFWGNTVDIWGPDLPAGQVRFSLIAQLEYSGIDGNISGDPLFIDASGGDFHLGTGSPAIDAGTSEGAPASDLDCRLRFDDLSTTNTGEGTFPYYDIGAYEFNGPLSRCPLE